MALHTDIPTRSEIERLLSTHDALCVSIYLPTSPVTQEAEGERIAFRNLVASALDQMREGGTPNDDVAAIEEALDDLHDDDDFWARQANSLAVFATPAGVRTFRLPNRLVETVKVSDRFHVKPLLRAVSFPQAAFVLALAQGSVRLVEVAADAPAHDVRVPDMPQDLESSVGREAITDRAARGRIQGGEGQKVRMGQYARLVDHALRSVLAGLDLPLILAAAEPLDGIFRALNSYPHLADVGIAGNPEEVSDADLAAAARGVLDQLYAAELAALRELFETRTSQGRGAIELSDVGRAATYGAVDTVLVDIDVDLSGVVDEESGVVTLGGDEAEYGVIDEIARRVLLSGGRVVAVRADDIPGGGAAAAILRYAV